ncbi:MAG: hypothetical protein ABEJ76_02205 [Halanaeroarchaeum sp.]
MTDTMDEVSHAHREDPRNVFGEMFRRGPDATADGGESAAPAVTMADVDHEGPSGTDASGVWSRGRVPGAHR